MAQLMVLDSIDEDIFICGHCKLVFNSLELFLDHKNTLCRKEEPNLQDINITSSNTANIRRDTQSFPAISEAESRIKKNVCAVCNKKFKTVKCLHGHMKSHEAPSQCLICGRCFDDNSHLKRHYTTHKVWPNGLNKTAPKSREVDLLSFSCLYCDCVLSNYTLFRAHMNNHLSLKKFKCIQGECNCFFETAESLLCHVLAAHSMPKYTCHICKKTFESLKDVATHRQDHNEHGVEMEANKVPQFKCTLCKATFKRPENLSLHMLTESHKKVCIHCNKFFVSDKRLRMHLQTHIKSKSYKCNICNTSYHLKKILETHMLKHGERQHTCDVCKYTFKRKDLLARHMKVHYLRKCYKCPFQGITECTKEFTRRDKLKNHIKSHTTCLKQNQSKQKTFSKEGRQFRVTDQVFLDIHRDDKPLGRVVIGLFGDLAPKAVNNFKVLSTKGIKGKSYKGTSFNRIIKRFMVQGGDVVSDDGAGTISIYGETFEDENLDTQHSTAGFVSMANKGRNTNGCQFIITTTGTPWLDGLHTVIGKVVEGQNVVHMVEHTTTDAEDRPTRRVHIADCGLQPTPQPFYISDDPYDLWAWIKASAVPLTMSFSILGFFHWMMKKMEI